MAAETAIQAVNPRNIDQANTPQRRSAWTYRPHVDILELPEEYLLVADVPGANEEGIDVSMESGVLTLQAEVPVRQAGSGTAQPVFQEYGVGNFHRRFEIDDSIDTESVSAEYRDGSLTIHLPKVQKVRKRRIPVTA